MLVPSRRRDLRAHLGPDNRGRGGVDQVAILAGSNLMNLPTLKNGTRLSGDQTPDMAGVTPSLSASSSMVNSLGTTTGPDINLLLGLVF